RSRWVGDDGWWLRRWYRRGRRGRRGGRRGGPPRRPPRDRAGRGGGCAAPSAAAALPARRCPRRSRPRAAAARRARREPPRLAADAGVTVKKKRLGRSDAVDPEADAPRFAVNLRGDAPGDHAMRLHVRFWLCGTRSCRPIDVRRTVTIAVAGAAPGDAGIDGP